MQIQYMIQYMEVQCKYMYFSGASIVYAYMLQHTVHNTCIIHVLNEKYMYSHIPGATPVLLGSVPEHVGRLCVGLSFRRTPSSFRVCTSGACARVCGPSERVRRVWARRLRPDGRERLAATRIPFSDDQLTRSLTHSLTHSLTN